MVSAAEIYVQDSFLTIQNNLFTNNSATWAGDQGEGGGLYISGGSVLAQFNQFIENFGAGFPGFPSDAIGYGGGAALVGGNSTLQYNTFLNNYGTHAAKIGAWVAAWRHQGTPQILSNDISSNYATAYEWGMGGGVAISDCLALVQGNMIVGNFGSISYAGIANSGEGGSGGGLVSLNAQGRIVGNTLLKNVAAQIRWGYGGGSYIQGSDLTIDGNYILGNTSSPGADSPGGGMRLVIGTNFTFTNNIVAGNASTTGSGFSVMANSSGIIIHNTIAENLTGDGVGVFVDSDLPVLLYNNVIVSQTIGILNDSPGIGSVNASHTLYENNITNYSTGVANSFGFSGPANLDNMYHLLPGSNAIDNGSLFAWILRDIDLDPRLLGLIPDLGADELKPETVAANVIQAKRYSLKYQANLINRTRTRVSGRNPGSNSHEC